MLRSAAGGVDFLLLEESDESTEICFLRCNDSPGSDSVTVRSSSRIDDGPSLLSSWLERSVKPFGAERAAEI